jgi:predicted tellurium resistance membrane protein TerC
MQNFFSNKNRLVILIGAVLLVVGFYLLGRGPADNKVALNVAPFVLMLAYVVVLPIGILMSKDKDGQK